MVVPLERAMAVHVRAHRRAVTHHNFAQHPQVAERALLCDEVCACQELAGGVVDCRHQAQAWPAFLEPVVTTAVPENHQPRLRSAIPTATVLRRTATACRPDARRAQRAPYRLSRD